ncbi:hypothetical protein DL98DRAFT_639008 [Cadophora sp. DSE1049]|nr:hypothetical protein DL98DRAFT_639008 [Cadophora sp. DSE1049]
MSSNIEQPLRVPSDTVIPLHTLDDASFYKRMVTSLTFQFNDILDAEKMGASLAQLISLEGWTKLGARIRKNDQGGFEYHVPEHFTPERPAIAFSSAAYQTSIHDDPVGSKFPMQQHDPALVRVNELIPGLKKLIFRPHAPFKIEEYLARDEPQISLHVVTFTDATLFTISYLHSLMDGLGAEALLRGWTAVLDGREQDVPRMIGYDKDPIKPLIGKTPGERNVQYNRYHSNPWVPTSIKMLDTTYTWLRIPDSILATLRDQAMQELRQLNPSGKEFVSRGDIFVAWLVKALVRTQSIPPSMNILIISAVNLRAVLSEVFPPDSAFVSNCVGGVHTYVAAKELLESSLATTALRLRQELNRQSTRENVESTLTLIAEKKTVDMNALPLTMSDCGKARFCEFDFSKAIKTPLEERASRRGRPAYLWGGVDFSPVAFPNMCVNWGTDAEDNWSTVLYVPSASLDALEKEVEGLKRYMPN